MHILIVPSFLRTNMTGAPHALDEGRTQPRSRYYSNWVLTSSSSEADMRY